MDKNWWRMLIQTLTFAMLLMGSIQQSLSSSTSAFTSSPECECLCTSMISTSGSTDNTSDSTNITNITTDVSSTPTSTATSTTIGMDSTPTSSTPTSITASTTVGMDGNPTSSIDNTNNAISTQTDSTSSTTTRGPSSTLPSRISSSSKSSTSITPSSSTSSTVSGTLSNNSTSQNQRETYSNSRNRSAKSRHERNLVYVVAPVVCFVSLICVIAIVCVVMETRKEEKRTTWVWLSDPKKSNVAGHGTKRILRNDKPDRIGWLRKIWLRCFPRRKKNLTNRGRKVTYRKEKGKIEHKETQRKQFVVFFPRDEESTETSDVRDKEEEIGEFSQEKSTDSREMEQQQTKEIKEMDDLNSTKVNQEMQMHKSVMDSKTSLDREISEVFGDETTVTMNSDERRTPESDNKQTDNVSERDEETETTLDRDISEVFGEATTLIINSAERRTPDGAELDTPFNQELCKAFIIWLVRCKQRCTCGVFKDNPFGDQSQEIEEELLRNAEMYVKLEEHKKLEIQVQVGEERDEQNRGKENGMKTPVDLDLDELLDSLKESEESTSNTNNKQDNADEHPSDGVTENETFTSLAEEKTETPGTDEFDQWDSSSDEEESKSKLEPVPVKYDLENEMQSSETSSRVYLKDADVQTYGEYDGTHLASKISVGHRQKRTKRGKVRDALSLKRKFWWEEEVSRVPKDNTNTRSGTKLSETKVQQRQLKSNQTSVLFDSKLEAEARERYSTRLNQIIGVYDPSWQDPQLIRKEARLINVREAPMDQYVRSQRFQPDEERRQSSESGHRSNTDELETRKDTTHRIPWY